jgi:hypothetical protein
MQNNIDIIKKQTDVDDDLLIERCLYENSNDILKTIMQLSNLKEKEYYKAPDEVFDEIRKIVDEKEKIYHDRNKHT